MDERKPEDRKGDHLKLAPPSLKAAVRRARLENSEQSEAVDDLRQAEIVRLELLLEALRPVLDQIPKEVEVFDVGVSHGERPRLFLDMISFVDLAHDRRTYRFHQDTRHGRVMIAESAQIDQIVQAMTNYIARRLVEREQTLAVDARSRPNAATQLATAARARELAKTPDSPKEAAPPRGFSAVAMDLFAFILMTLGSFTLAAIVGIALWAAWTGWGRDLWTARFGAAPF